MICNLNANYVYYQALQVAQEAIFFWTASNTEDYIMCKCDFKNLINKCGLSAWPDSELQGRFALPSTVKTPAYLEPICSPFHWTKQL